MAEGKSIHEIHLGFVKRLKARGEQVVQPRGKPMGVIKGYDKTIGLISAGTIYLVYKQFDIEAVSTFELLQDMCTHAYTDVRGEDLGLCDAKCWYEAIEDASKERAEKQAATLPRVELIPLLKQEHILDILSGLIEAIQLEKGYEMHGGSWKQDFLGGLKVPVEIKKMLGYEEE